MIIRSLVAVSCLLLVASRTYGQTVVAPHCGIRAVILAAERYGKSVDLNRLNTPAFVSSPFGSSMRELEAACRLAHLECRVMSELTVADLQAADRSAILHARPAATDSQYVHYLFLTDATDDGATLIDGSTLRRWHATWPEVAALSDGNALLVSDRPVTMWAARRGSGMRVVVVLLMVATAVFVLRRFARFRPFGRPLWNRAVRVGSLLGGAAVTAVPLQLTASDGLLRADGGRAIAAANRYRFLPEVDASYVENVLDRGGRVIDARNDRDFTRGRVPDSENISAADLQEVRAIAGAGDRDAELVVYCSDEHCGASDLVAQVFVEAGYRNVKLYRGGYRDWSAR